MNEMSRRPVSDVTKKNEKIKKFVIANKKNTGRAHHQYNSQTEAQI